MSVAGKLRIELPDEERGRSEYDLKELDRINARLAKNGYKASADSTAAEKREADLQRRMDLERRPQLRADQQWQKTAMAETEALAESRGEALAAERSGVKRIVDRDPLFSLARSGVLNQSQIDAGLAVREMYDLRRGDASTATFDGMPAGSHDHEQFVGNRFLRAKATIPAGQLETAILNGHFRSRTGSLFVLKGWPKFLEAGMQPHVSLQVLRWVCCEDNTLTSLGRGRAYDRNRKALCWALDVANEVLDVRTSGTVRA